MSRAIDTLKNLLQVDEKLIGQVIDIIDNELLIATSRGLKKAALVTGITINDKVLIFQGTVIKISNNVVPVYYI